MLRPFLAATTFVALVTGSVTAHAEGAVDAGHYCSIAYAPDGVSVPANLPALRVLRGNDVVGLTVKEVLPVSPVPSLRTTAVGEFTYFYLDAPLAVGTKYTIDFDFGCARGQHMGHGPMTFETTEEMPLPTKIGTAAMELEDTVPTLVITPTRELDAYLALVDFDFQENGARLSGHRLQRAGDKVHFAVSPASTTCLADDDLVREKTVRIGAKVIGAMTSPQSLEVPMLFDCRKSARATRPAATDADESGGGCQTAPYSASTAFVGGALAVMAIGMLRRRARRRAKALARTSDAMDRRW